VKVIRKRLSEVEAAGTNTTRWNVDCVCFQTFDPFTQTWYENPAADPRTNTIYLLPPRTVGDIRCDSAANMRAKLETMLDQFFINVEIAQLINAIVGVVLVFQPGGGLLIALIIAFVEAIIEIGVAAILFDFNPPEVWEFIQCALYQEMEPDGTITAEGMEAARIKIDSEYPGTTIGAVILLQFALLGTVGMNNAGSTGDESGDCSECPITWCYTWDFNLDAYDFLPRTGSAGWGGTWVSGQGWVNTPNPSLAIAIQTPIEIVVNAASFHTDNFGVNWSIRCSPTLAADTFTWSQITDNFSGQSLTCPAGEWIFIFMQCSEGSQGSHNIDSFTLQGTGEPPFGDDTC